MEKDSEAEEVGRARLAVGPGRAGRAEKARRAEGPPSFPALLEYYRTTPSAAGTSSSFFGSSVITVSA
ncbi:MAG: hypothetical protein N3A38_14470, partial [Planctomycetota bacterium]|nr:hypothetical protein [Planctomycetota bacterium]